MKRLALPVLLLLATCAHRPEPVPPLDLSADHAAPVAADRVLVGERGAYVLGTGGAFVAAFAEGPRGEAPGAPSKWIDAAEIDALEGGGRWTLALDGAGVIHRLRGGGGLEPMNERLGVPRAARHMQAAGRALAVLGDQGLFVVDATHVVRFDVHGRELAACRGAVAVIDQDTVRWVDLETKRSRSFPVEEPRAIALTASGVLVVATERAVYRENGSGELARRYLAEDEIGALAIDGERVWFSDGPRVGVLDDTSTKLTGEIGAKLITQIAPTATDVWIVEGARARRLARPAEAFPPEIERIARASCSPCHQRARVAFDLSTPIAFRARGADVVRVLTSGEMPPPGRPLPSADRSRLLEWARAR